MSHAFHRRATPELLLAHFGALARLFTGAKYTSARCSKYPRIVSLRLISSHAQYAIPAGQRLSTYPFVVMISDLDRANPASQNAWWDTLRGKGPHNCADVHYLFCSPATVRGTGNVCNV